MLTSTLELSDDELMLGTFRFNNSDLFQKNDRLLFTHIGLVLAALLISTFLAVTVVWVPVKIILSTMSAFLIFCLINATLHHHHTHHNAAKSQFANKVLDVLYYLLVPNASRRLFRYRLAHLNHHFQPFHESDVDHHYGLERYLRMKSSIWKSMRYFLELTFVGAYMPGWEDYHFMNRTPMEDWSQKGYQDVKKNEIRQARKLALIQWSLFFVFLKFIPVLAWGCVLPMLLVKNWAHFLGQFQHYDERFLGESLGSYQKTKTFRCPGWLNYLAAGEIASHSIHHIYPEIPYYRIQQALERFAADQELAAKFLIF